MTSSTVRLRILGGIALVLIGLVVIAGALATGASVGWDWNAELSGSRRIGSDLPTRIVLSGVVGVGSLVAAGALLRSASRLIRAKRLGSGSAPTS